MTHYKKRLLLTVALISVIGLSAQTVYPDIVVKYPIKGDLVNYFPYSTVRVIDNRWYIKLKDSSYLKLNRQGDTYGFYIPRNLPDMYAMLSMEENQIHTNSSMPSYTGGNGGGFLIWMAASLVVGAINDGVDNNINNKMEKRMITEGLKHNYRYCTLNMDNGDIMYNDK